jgi:hypothetical protein
MEEAGSLLEGVSASIKGLLGGGDKAK